MPRSYRRIDTDTSVIVVVAERNGVMGWYLRKSLRLGPLRINLSKSGVGGSVGVTGLRVGTGPKGPYLQGGRDGLYFRESLSDGAPDDHPGNKTREPDPEALEAAPAVNEEAETSTAPAVAGFIGWQI